MADVEFTALGGANQIGASCYILDFPGCSVAVDFGAGQDTDPLVEKGRRVDEIFFTHGHRDHVGRAPWAVQYWPNARLWATQQTKELAHWLWRDEIRVALKNDKAVPFTSGQVTETMRRLKQVTVGQSFWLTEDLKVTPYHAGHILGAVMYRFNYKGADFVVTGDMSLKDHTFVDGARLPDISRCEALIRESTYVGELPGAERGDIKQDLCASVRAVLQAGGRVVIPTLSIDRLPEVFHTLHEDGIDSEWPLWVIGGNDPLETYIQFAGKTGVLKAINRFRNRQERLEALESREPMVVLATSGMALPDTPAFEWMTAVLEEAESAVFFVNYQDPRMPGGRVLSAPAGGQVVLGAAYQRLCQVRRFDLSTHAKEDEMAQVEGLLRPNVVVHVHGEDAKIQSFIDGKNGCGPERHKALVGRTINL